MIRLATTAAAIALSLASTSALAQQMEAETYVSGQTVFLPDPQRSTYRMTNAPGTEILIADSLNASLDTWRICGWGGAEAEAAAYNAWSRTHLVGDRRDPGRIEVAYKPMARTSFARTEATKDTFERTRYCQEMRPIRASLKEDMERQADMLMRMHGNAHRR